MTNLQVPWERARRGLHTVVWGRALGEPPQGLRVVRVSCDVPLTPVGPLLEARARIERILGTRAPLVEKARTRVMSGLRRHLLGDVASATSEGSLVEVYNRLAQLGPSALVLDAADAADPASLAMLQHILARPGWLRLPVVLVLRSSRSSEVTGAMASLVEAVRGLSGEEALVGLSAADAGEAPARDDDRREAVRALPPDVLRVLRALALVGSGCEAALLAAVLDMPELAVLDALQLAADAGVPLDDRGEGRFHLPPDAIARLRQSMLPSLAAALHRRIAANSGSESPERALEAPLTLPEPIVPDAPVTDEPARPSDPWEVMKTSSPPAPAPATPVAAPPAEVAPPSEAPPPYKPFSGEAEVQPPPSTPEERAADRFDARPRSAAPPANEALAARHLEAAGDADAAISRYFLASRKAAAAAAYPQAVAHANAALALLDRLPQSDTRRVQRAELLLEVARLQWHGSGADESFTLQGALRVADGARASLREGDPVDLAADIAVTRAAILCDVGDLDSLTLALDELTSASRALSRAGASREAARLFNDQASVFLRMGDPVRAAHLLTESKRVFEASSKSDPVAMVEMAETDHLFARILLNVAARPGREDDALSVGLDHALAAERAFKKLGAPREASRVLETMGRLELRRGRIERAAERVTTAARIQESIGDVVGLARSTAALSDVMVRGGQLVAGLGLLGDSLELNFEKGSKLGLAYNRQTLERLGENEEARRSHPELLEQLAARLSELEGKLGRTEIPGASDPR